MYKKISSHAIPYATTYVLDCWEEVHSVEPNTIEEVYNEYIFNNQYIHSGNQPLQYKLLKMPKNVAKDWVLRDIMSNQGKILTLPDIEGKFLWIFLLIIH